MDFERLKDYCQHTQICQNKFPCKKNEIWDKNAFGLYAGLSFEELLSHLTSALSNMSLNNILYKTNNFQTWNQKCLICVTLGCNFEKLLAYLKSTQK